METITLNIILANEDGLKVNLKLNDIRSDVTGTEVSELANKLIDEKMLINRGKDVVTYIGAEKIIIEPI